MNKDKIFLGNTMLHSPKKNVGGIYTTFEGEDFFVIENYNQMPPFFMTVVSSTDHWLFISSNGALSAGRKNPENAIFPYYTDDKITDSSEITGPKTIMHVKKDDKVYLWEPFKKSQSVVYSSSFNLYKNIEGNKIIFEHINHDLKLCFRYGWMFSENYGLVKKSWLQNLDETSVEIELVDGLQNILPSGVDSVLQNIRSTLVNAYKRSELTEDPKVAIFSLSSMIVDKAEPAEALRATSAWHCGIKAENVLLSDLQIDPFREGYSIHEENDIKAEKGAYYINSKILLAPNEHSNWYIVSDVNQSHTSIVHLKTLLKNELLIQELLEKDILLDKQKLRIKIGLSDGIQLTADQLSCGRHFTNVLFNIMRGGTFDDIYDIETSDFFNHINGMNKALFKRYTRVLNALPEKVSFHQLRYFLLAADHPKIFRFYLEYLPLSFSRRHGDPSRPWNYFTIDIKDNEGNKVRNYEGNWRDIFQNWEALAYSFPEFSLSMISKFVNASTIDGYNPYRITRNGIDWEVVDPNDAWSHIGYWGDHQIIYLSKFIEFSMKFHPLRLKSLLNREVFTYANVPYRIKGYDAIVINPKNTIEYNAELAQDIEKKVLNIGSDGKMIWLNAEELLYVNLSEKLLVTVLTKLYNFIPDGGLWLNTQRPEWNDANNALVGNGLSVVTICYLSRFLKELRSLYSEVELNSFQINKAVMDLLDALRRGFERYENCLEDGFTPSLRRDFMDDFGIAGEHYRTTAYAGFTGEKRVLSKTKMIEFIDLANKYLNKTIKNNLRSDGLYHAYNLINLSEGESAISHLYEMLEGQVAILSAKELEIKETLKVVDALKNSEMFRADQYSYLLYPDRDLPHFLNKNCIPEEELNKVPILLQMVNEGESSIVERDGLGDFHFNSYFQNSNDLFSAIDRIKDDNLRQKSIRDKQLIGELFEKVFKHYEFTGRSGAFYGYEGLGSIYWHMVSKLLLSIQENLHRFREKSETMEYGKLIEHYYEIRAGIGINKMPDLYGAFPTDAYSHTPKYAGAKQPGMTGQVKEDIINRWAELGVTATKGKLTFEPFLLRKSEFIEEESQLEYVNHRGEFTIMKIPAFCLAFTFCQLPVIYQISDSFLIKVFYTDGSGKVYDQPHMEEQDSKDIFKRKGNVSKLHVCIKRTTLI